MDKLEDLSRFDAITCKRMYFGDPDNNTHWSYIEDVDGVLIAVVDPECEMDVMSRIDICESIVALPHLLAALKESRKENEELREKVGECHEFMVELLNEKDAAIGFRAWAAQIKEILEGKQ